MRSSNFSFDTHIIRTVYDMFANFEESYMQIGSMAYADLPFIIVDIVSVFEDLEKSDLPMKSSGFKHWSAAELKTSLKFLAQMFKTDSGISVWHNDYFITTVNRGISRMIELVESETRLVNYVLEDKNDLTNP